jgi:hypothetical protein
MYIIFRVNKNIFMRILKIVLPIIAVILFCNGCKKNNDQPGDISSLNIVNAIPGSDNLVTNFNGITGKMVDTFRWYNTALQIGYGSSQIISSYSGATPLSLSQISDTLHSLYAGTLNLPAGTIHTLFLTGTVASPDTLFTTDTPPYHPAMDSSVGVRFVNLSPGSDPISVNIQGQANGTEAASLSYKAITSFKNYPAIGAVDSYTFEFRDIATDIVLATYTLYGINDGLVNTNTNYLRYRNLTIALIGLPGAASDVPQTTIQINNY